MNILIVSHGYPSKIDPQWGCFEKDQAEVLALRGHKVSIIAIDGRLGRSSKWGIRHVNEDRINAYIYYFIPYKFLLFSKLKKYVKERMMLRLFRFAIKKERLPDIIYVHYLFEMANIRLIKKKFAIPIVGIEHWSELNNDSLSPDLVLRGKIGYNITDRLLAVSPGLSKQIKRFFDKDSDVVYDMVNSIYLNQPLLNNKNRSPFKFVSAGSLIRRKGYDLLIKAFSLIEDRKAELYIIGGGVELSNLKKLCIEQGVSDRVHFTGLIGKKEMVKYLSEADVFALASRNETFGVVYIEAMAMGLPVVATVCGGPEYFVTSDNGLLVNTEDTDGLVAAMNSIEKNIDKYNSDNIRKYVNERFSGEAIAAQLENIFKEILDNRQ